MNKPHKHAKEIKAWADGATIEYFSKSDGSGWVTLHDKPCWLESLQYRVKPEEIVKYGLVTISDNKKSTNCIFNDTYRLQDGELCNLELTFNAEGVLIKATAL